MSLSDKFSIIENHLIQDERVLISKLENYFENYLNSDLKILSPDYINQIIWFSNLNSEELINNIEINIKKYLIQRRNNIRSFIKKQNFELNNLNKFIKIFISKLEYLNMIIKTSDDKIIKNGIYELSNLIISDSLILIFIEEQIICLDQSINSEIEKFIDLTKSLNKYDNFETYNKVIQTISNIFKKQILLFEDPPLPENLKRINKLIDILNYCKNIIDYFKFMNDDINKLTYTIHQSILENLINILKYNNIDEIQYIIINIWPDFTKIIINYSFDGKDDLIKNIATEIIGLIERTIRTENQNSNIFKLISIINNMELLITNSTIKTVINQKLSLGLSSDKFIDDVHININKLINEGKEKDVLKILNIISTIKDKDIFIGKYYQNLIKRLLEKFSLIKSKNFEILKDEFKEHIIIEKNIANYLKIKFGDKSVYKINKVIFDTEFSFDDNLNFNNISIDNFSNVMSVITTSYLNWDINQNEGIVNNNMIDEIKETILGKHLKYYQTYYNLRYSNKRIINWYPHFGEVKISYLNKDFIMLPIQFMILEMFSNVNRQNIKSIMNASFLKNYSSKFIHDLIGSLILSELFKLNNDDLILKSSIDSDIKFNLIDIFFTNSDYSVVWEQKRKDELIHSREEIINTNINHFLKKKSLNKKELFEIVKNNIDIFELNNDLYNKCLEYLIKYDYIKENNDLYEKIIY